MVIQADHARPHTALRTRAFMAENSMKPAYFKDQVLWEIFQGSRGNWRLGCRTHLTFHDDNPPVQTNRRVSERLREYGFILGFDESPFGKSMIFG
jgi:hypothetical protein